MRLYRVLGIVWMAVCGVSAIKCLWVVLYYASLFRNAFYYSVAWGFCLLYLTGAVAGLFLFRAAKWAPMLIGCVSVLIVLATIAALGAFGNLPTLYYLVGVLGAASLALMYVSAIIKLAA